MTDDDVIKDIKKRIEKSGTLFAFAGSIGFSPAYVSDVVNRNRGLSDTFLDRLGYERVCKIRRKK